MKKKKLTLKAKTTIGAAFGVTIVSLAAFALSFDAMRQLALIHNVNPYFAWILPVAVDFAILVYSLASIIRRMAGIDARIETALVFFVTLTSVTLNAFHTSSNIYLGYFVLALPPLLMASSVETITRMITTKHDKKKVIAKKRAATKAKTA